MSTEENETYKRLHDQITERGPWSQTASGGAFFLADPRVEDVRITDIAHSLGRQCRYNGHCKDFYSIAQHAVHVANWMKEDGLSPLIVYAGLHHDSAETYTGDVVSQLKYLFPAFKAIEAEVEDVIFEALGVSSGVAIKKIVKDYDLIALSTEKRDLLSENLTEYSWGDLPEPRHFIIHPWRPEVASLAFMEAHLACRRSIKEFLGG